MADLKSELRQVADDAARQARPMAVADVIQAGERRHLRIILAGALMNAGAFRRAHGWQSAAVAGLAAVLAGALIAVVVGTPRSVARAPRVMTVADVANLAAAAAAKQPAIRPGQWIYRKTLNNAWGGSRSGMKIGITESWYAADGKEMAYYLHGKLVVSRVTADPQMTNISPRTLLSLSANPRALLARLACTRPAAWSVCQGAFTIIGGMLAGGIMPPNVTADLYHALADIPGVTINKNAVDLAGRPGIALADPMGHGTVQEIILSKRSHTYMGSYFGINPLVSKADGEALLRQAFVSGPGVRP
jgi:hypothetical protein